VSSTLLEMKIAMSSEGTDASLVPQAKAGLGKDFPNAREREFGELLFPGVEQRHGVAAGDHEEQFEILAVGQRGQQGWLGRDFSAGLEACCSADRNGGREQFGAELGG